MRSSRANKIIYQTARTQPQCEGMGTTVVAALFFDNKVTIAHVGDSRLYRLRSDKLEQVTHGPLAAAGTGRPRASTPPRRRSGPQTRTTSHARSASSPTSRWRCRKSPVQKGDFYVLCSDGLSDMVEDDDIHLTISTFSANLDTVAKQLIQLANDNGGRDNVSVVMAQVMDSFPAAQGIFDKILGWFG